MLDEVDNETVDDYACSEEAPASKSEKPDNFNEVLLVLEQMLMVVKGMYRVIIHGSSLRMAPFSLCMCNRSDRT